MDLDPGDTLTIRRVANGWVIAPGPIPGTTNAFVHVYTTPADLAKHVEAWATAQTAAFPGRVTR